MTNVIEKIQDDEEFGKKVGLLTKLYRQVLIERGVGPAHWDRLMEKYLDDPRRCENSDTRERNSDRSNMTGAAAEDNMTIKTFIKSLTFLRPERITFVVTVEFDDEHILERLRGTTITQEIGLPLSFSGEEGPAILAEWYRRIDEPLGITPKERETLIERYLKDPRNSVPRSKDKRTSAKGNIKRYYSATELSWINFHRCIQILAPSYVYYDVLLLWKLIYTESRHQVYYSSKLKKPKKGASDDGTSSQA